MFLLHFIVVPTFLPLMVLCRVQVLSARKGSFIDRYQDQGALEIRTTTGLLGCQAACVSNTECLSYFYNRIEKRCILHGDSFTYSHPTETGVGWNFYMTADVTGRCPPTDNFMYQRDLDLCFNLNPPETIDFIRFKSMCQLYGGELVRIETARRQKFIEMILANETTDRICIQGTDSINNGVWTFDDGTVMNYTNWDSGEPDYNQGYLEMYTGYRWHDLGATSPSPCLPICEKRV